MKLLRLGRLAQYLTSKGVLQRVEARRAINYDRLSLMQFGFFLMVLMHCMGCGLFIVPTLGHQVSQTFITQTTSLYPCSYQVYQAMPYETLNKHDSSARCLENCNDKQLNRSCSLTLRLMPSLAHFTLALVARAMLAMLSSDGCNVSSRKVSLLPVYIIAASQGDSRCTRPGYCVRVHLQIIRTLPAYAESGDVAWIARNP